MSKECTPMWIYWRDTKKTMFWLMKRLSLNNDLMMEKSKTLQAVMWSHYRMLDTKWDTVISYIEESNDLKRSLISDNKYWVFKKSLVGFIKKVWMDVNKWKVTTEESRNANFDEYFSNYTKDQQLWVKTLFENLDWLYWTENSEFLLSKHNRGYNWNDLFYELSNTIKWSPENSIHIFLKENWQADLSKEWAISFLKDRLVREVWNIWSDTAIQNLVDSLMWKWVKSVFTKNKIVKGIITEMRDIWSHLKFALNVPTNLIFWSNALVMSWLSYIAKKRWLEELTDSNLVKYLRENQSIMSNESRLGSFNVSENQWVGYSLYNRILDSVLWKTVWKVSKWKAWQYTEWFLKWGSQVTVDQLFENWIKNMSIAQALSKMWVNSENSEQFLKMLKDWKLDHKIFETITSDAHINYNRFYTNSSLIANTRDRFSSWISMNYLTHYVTARSAELIDWFRKWVLDYKSWAFHDVSFSEYLSTHNPELRWFIYNILHNLSLWYYLNEYIWDNDKKNTKEKIYSYMTWMNDSISSLSATVPYRLIASLFNYPADYSKFKESQWESMTGMDYATASAFWFASTAIRSVLRELKIADALIWTSWLAMQWFSYDAVMNNLTTMIDKSVNWMWRFWAVEWFESYWLKKVPEYDDMLWLVLMNLDQTNESIKKYQELRTVEWIVSAIKWWNFLWEIWNQIVYSNIWKVVKSWNWLITWTSKLWAEPTYNLSQELINKDEVLQDLYNWNFNVWVLKDKDWLYDSNIIKKVFTDLTAFNYWYNARKKWANKWTNKIWYWNDQMNNAKEEIFVQDLFKKFWETKILDVIAKWWIDIRNQWIRKLLLMADNDTVWAWKAIVWYMANKDYLNMVNKANQAIKYSKYPVKSTDNLSEDTINSIKASIIAKYYPTHSAFWSELDQQSWYKLIETRLKTLEPKVFKIDAKYQQYYNSLWLLDYVAYTEWKKADPSASKIQNIFSVVWKFIKDPKLKVQIANHTMKTINSLHVNDDIKTMLKTWVLVWNMSEVWLLMKDEKFYKENKKAIDTFNDFMFSNNHDLNIKWSKLIVNDLSKTWKKAYNTNWYTKYWKKKGWYPSNTKNANLVKNFKNKMPTINKMPRSYNIKQSWWYVNPKNFPYSNIRKSLLNIRSKMSFNPYRASANTEHLVKWYVRKSPWDVLNKITYRWKKVYIRKVNTRKRPLI